MDATLTSTGAAGAEDDAAAACAAAAATAAATTMAATTAAATSPPAGLEFADVPHGPATISKYEGRRKIPKADLP
eukprot:11829886-Heterocapsa_arctica.AAC.1